MALFYRLSVAVRHPIVNMVPKPTPLTYIGEGRLREIPRLLAVAGKKRVLVLCGTTLYRRGDLDWLLAAIRAAGTDVEIFPGIPQDPTFAVVEEAGKHMMGCDAILAIGGGSVLDTAKAVAASAACGCPAEKLAGILKVKETPVMQIAVPTTAGTGSETTIAAVISDSMTHAKRQILDPRIVPTVAILDPQLTVGLPPHTTVSTAMDALTHALEAYTATYATPETDRYAEMAIKMIYEALPRAWEVPEDMQAREQLLVASFLAGMAFTTTYVGYVHAFAHTIGGKFGVAHGLANAVLLPHIMEYYLPVCEERFAHLAEMTGVSHAESRNQRARDFVGSIVAMSSRCNIPRRLQNFPREAIDDVVKMAFRECHGTYPVPRYYTRAEARKLLEKVCAP